MISFEKEQIFIVTGASSGIGETVSILLNELGASVVAIARNEKRLGEMKSKCKYPENVYLEIKDLAEDIENLPNYIKSLKEKYGKFSGMAYCAGVASLEPLKILDYNKAKDTFAINYHAPISMLKALGDKRVCIGSGTSCVFVSSASALLSDKGHCVYSGSKAALNASLKCIAKELAISGIRVNSVSPTVISTPMTISAGKEYIEEQSLKYPMGVGESIDVAKMIIFLLSKDSKWITGQNYVVDCASF